MKTQVMVELRQGYGYGVVELDYGGNISLEPGRKVTQYENGWPMEKWVSAIHAQAQVALVDKGVKVLPHAVVRVIGPLDCAEASRVRAKRYSSNWADSNFIDQATDEEIIAAMGHTEEPETYAAMCDLRKKYAA